ncbi:MAG: hypothetical protein HY773_00750 [Candidatus Terrybacteria bacterium]|nr:hypothetical protein [Candidatus Terrybacteria bacterium]
MAKLTPQKLREIYISLPDDIRNVLFGDEILAIIKNISQKHNLIFEKTGILSDEIGSVMMGLSSSRDFAANLVQRLETDQQTAGKIAEDIDAQIFSKVRESLGKIGELRIKNQELRGETGKDEILKEIERDHGAEVVSQPAVVSKVEPHYPAGDPYREAVK